MSLETWIIGKGIDMVKMPSAIVEQETKRESSFKKNSEFVKSNLNHKFNIKRDIDSGILSLYERVNRLIFERV